MNPEMNLQTQRGRDEPMADLDYKAIGMAAKDLVFGIGTAAAGASGGPAASEGVMKASNGIDKLIGMALPDENKKQTRGDQFDRGDFGPRQPTPALGPETLGGASSAHPRDNSAGAHSTEPSTEETEGPLSGDAKTTASHLRTLGWSRDKIQQILRGPDQASLAALTRKETKGFRAVGAAGTRVPEVGGSAVPLHAGRALPVAPGQSVPTALGTRVKDDFGSGTA